VFGTEEANAQLRLSRWGLVLGYESVSSDGGNQAYGHREYLFSAE
jgi:hypothetical protein